jgi:MoxR-like ATPase
VVPYPEEEDEREIVDRDALAAPAVRAVADCEVLRALRLEASAVHVADAVRDYAVRLVRATREPESAGVRIPAPLREGVWETSGDGCIALGASPRASMYLVRAARARALIDGRGFVTPHDVKRVAMDVLRHRVVVTYEAVVEGVLASVETA